MITWDHIAEWVSHSVRESETLDFKAAFWTGKASRPAAEEIAKDVAAFANHRGGTIVVGVSDRDDCADGFSTAELPDRPDQVVTQALDRHLTPRSAAQAAHVYLVTGVDTGTPRTVLVVEVRGWPHGPVAVRREGGLYQLPVRRGTHTIEISWEDAMRDLTSSHRRDLLRFQSWQKEHTRLTVLVGSPIRAVLADGRRITVPVPIEQHFAELAGVDEDVVHLSIIRTAYVKHVVAMEALKPMEGAAREAFGAPLLTLFGGMAAQEAWNRSTPSHVPIPFELIRAAWIERVAWGVRLHVLLDGELVFGGERWYVRPEGG